MRPANVHRIRRRASRDTSMQGKDNAQEHGFFGAPSHEPFFQPAPAIQRKCDACEKEDKKAAGSAEKKEEEKLQRTVAGKEELKKSAGSEEKKEEKPLQRTQDKKEEEKTVHRSTEKKEEDKLHRTTEKKEEDKLSKKEGSGSNGNGSTASSYISSINSKGQPMPANQVQFYNSRMGYDFSDVKIHTGRDAADSARDVNAKAYTYGNNVVFNEGQYNPGTHEGQKLMAHELTHVVQQNGGTVKAGKAHGAASGSQYRQDTYSASSEKIQRSGDPKRIPPGMTCPTSLAAGAPGDADLVFSNDMSTITGSHTLSLVGFVISWLLRGGTNNILIHGFASTEGTDEHNWALSCRRAEAVRSELIRLGVPPVRIRMAAHGETSDFGAAQAPNRRVVVNMTGRGFFPLITGTLTPHDNFAGRSRTRFGVGETIDLNFMSFPFTPASDFGGLEWHVASGAGTLSSSATNDGTGTFTAPATASAVQLQLRVATGLLAGRVLSSHSISVVEPSAISLVPVPGSFPSFGGWGNPPIPPGTWGAGMQADVFILPRDVSFQGVTFGEGTVAPAVTGTFLSVFGTHPSNTFGPGGAGNISTGTPLAPAQDGIWNWRGPAGTFLGIPFCEDSTFLWAIPWEYMVPGAARMPFAGGFRANHLVTATLGCRARLSKVNAGPFCRNINGSTC